MPAANDHEDVRLPRLNPAARPYESHEAAYEIPAASFDNLRIHSVAVASKKGGHGRPKPLTQLPALILETCELIVRTSGNQLGRHFQRRARILEEATQAHPVEAADFQERQFA